MKKLHKFVLKSFVGPLVLTFFIVIFVLLLQFLWKYIDDLVGKGLEIPVISELLLYTSASLVPMALPLAVLLASLMTFGNLGENYELIALKAAGISLQRIMMPLIILMIFVSAGAFLFSNHVIPYTNLKMRTLLYDVQQQKPELSIKEGIFYHGIDNYSIKISKKDNKTNLLKGIMIYDHTDRRGNVSVTIADSGYMKVTEDKQYLLVTLYNGYNYVEMGNQKRRRSNEKTYPARRDKFETQTIYIELTGFGLSRTDESLFKSNYQMMNLDQLKHTKDSLDENLEKVQHRFARTIRTTNYFKREARRALKDTLDTLPTPEAINIDTMYHNLPPQDKKRVLSQALTFARSAESYIESQKITYRSKMQRLKRFEVEWHRKFTLSFACLIFFFIGAPLGAIIRKGGLGMPVVISVAFFVVYYIISLMGEKLVRETFEPALKGMWLSSYILLPLGIFLTYKATSDSVILNMDTYVNFFKKVFVSGKKGIARHRQRYR